LVTRMFIGDEEYAALIRYDFMAYKNGNIKGLHDYVTKRMDLIEIKLSSLSAGKSDTAAGKSNTVAASKTLAEQLTELWELTKNGCLIEEKFKTAKAKLLV